MSFTVTTLVSGQTATVGATANRTAVEVDVGSGVPGMAAEVSVGSVTTVNSTSVANVINSGNSSIAVLDFYIPRGTDGVAPTISVGNTTTVNTGLSANVAITGNATSVVLNFGIPAGGASRIVSYPSSSTLTINTDTTDTALHTNTLAAGSTLTVATPTGTPIDGQRLVVRLKTTNSLTLTFGSGFAVSSDLPFPLGTTGSEQTDYLGFIYNATASKWHLIAKIFGF